MTASKPTDSDRLDFYFMHHMNHGGERLFAVVSPVGRMWMLLHLPGTDNAKILEGEYPTFRHALDEAMRREGWWREEWSDTDAE